MEPPQAVFGAVMEAVRATPNPAVTDVLTRGATKLARAMALLSCLAGVAYVIAGICADLAGPPRSGIRAPTPSEALLLQWAGDALPEPNAVDVYLEVAPTIPNSNYGSRLPYPLDAREDERLNRLGRRQLALIRDAFGLEGRPVHKLTGLEKSRLDSCIALLGAHGREAQRRGDAEEACVSGVDVLRLAQDIARGGGFANVWWALGSQRVGQRLLADNTERLDRRATARVLARLQALERTGVTLDSVVRREARTSFPSPAPSFGPVLGNWVQPDRARHAQWIAYFGKLLDQARKPASVRVHPEPPAGLLPWRDPDWPRVFMRYFDTNDARMNCIEVALAVRQFRLSHGRLPRTLSELPSSARRADPFCLNPPRYRVTNAAREGFVLYSIGPDLRDDFGKPAPEDSRHPTGDVGVRPFAVPTYLSASHDQDYRRVPYMLRPIRGAGWPPMPDEE